MCPHGVALVDKPVGLSSFAVVARMRRLFREYGVDKAGHTGTLDPLASGLLPICIGQATRYAQRMLDAEKAYRARIQLGRSTTTWDLEGETLATAAWNVDPSGLQEILTRFEGWIEQRPPAFSAIKIQGQAAYARARRGEVIELPLRRVRIHRLRLLDFDAELGRIELEVRCSKGTYIRSLAHDLALALGTVGHLAALQRTETGGMRLDDARTLEQWEQASAEQRLGWLCPTETLLRDLPAIELADEEVQRLRQGKRWPRAGTDGLYRARSAAHGLLGLVRIKDGMLLPERLLAV